MEESVARQAASAKNRALSVRPGQLSVARRDAVHSLAGSRADSVMTTASSARHSLQVARLPLIARLVGKAMALGYRLVGKHRYDDFRVERIYGVPFVVIPSVFNPKVPRTGEFFAS